MCPALDERRRATCGQLLRSDRPGAPGPGGIHAGKPGDLSRMWTVDGHPTATRPDERHRAVRVVDLLLTDCPCIGQESSRHRREAARADVFRNTRDAPAAIVISLDQAVVGVLRVSDASYRPGIVRGYDADAAQLTHGGPRARARDLPPPCAVSVSVRA